MTSSPDSRLAEHDVDPIRGFLPGEDPLQRLPARYVPWERLAFDLPALVSTHLLRDAIEELPLLDTDALESEAELRRAMLLLSVLGGACAWSRPEPPTRLPRSISIPWSEVAERLDRPMIISHASIVLHNWRRIDPAGEIVAKNLRTLQCFRGGPDEEWFYLVTVEIEARGARALPLLLAAREAAATGDTVKLATSLEALSGVIDDLIHVLGQMEPGCRHDVFYHRVRPFLSGWPEPGMIYEGVTTEPVQLHGGSAAQSSLIQSIDAGLDVPHPHPGTRPFLMAMRHYMPPRHRAFVELLELGPSTRDAAAGSPSSADAYDACIDALDRFRKAHMGITARYITQQARSVESAIGTGGTEYADFLRRTRTETNDRRIGN
ncbi:MAG: hypothetical protein CMJ36_02930 [Phycisphaerae bacterium]|nr:hypothetical protein [Phycisphaerae bacterium]